MRRTDNHKFSHTSRRPARVKSACHVRAFSLVELLVVIAIIILLLGIFLPVLSNVRKSSRSTACLANVQQWGYSYQMYVTSNHGKTLSEEGGNYVTNRRWWIWMMPFNGDVRRTLTCPEARESQSVSPRHLDYGEKYFAGAATSAWLVTGDAGDFVGSYGINLWVYRPQSPKNTMPHLHFPVSDPSHIPLLGDCCWPWAIPLSGDAPPKTITGYPEPGVGIDSYCIDRHRMAVNLVFLDGHAEKVSLAELWKLKWAQDSVPKSVTLPN